MNLQAGHKYSSIVCALKFWVDTWGFISWNQNVLFIHLLAFSTFSWEIKGSLSPSLLELSLVISAEGVFLTLYIFKKLSI